MEPGPSSSALPAPQESTPEVDAEKAIIEFAAITGVDEGLAHFFLQDYEFDLQKALNVYYRNLERTEKQEVSLSSSSGVVDNDADSDIEVMDVDSPGTLSVPSQVNVDHYPEDITVMTWNVDGIDEGNLATRFKGVIYVIAKINPDIILLQEVVHAHMHEIRKVMGSMYHIIVPDDDEMPYFTATLVSKMIFLQSKNIEYYSNTLMGRTMTVFSGQLQKLKLVIINSHLESTREYANSRKQQFNRCMKKMEESMGPNTLVIFGGDLNIRDAEIGTLHPAIKDAWIAAGSKVNTKYTWDCKLNKNKELPPNVRCRFDRVYFNGPYKKVDFSLAGTQQIRKIFRHPSDHFAVVCKFTQPE